MTTDELARTAGRTSPEGDGTARSAARPLLLGEAPSKKGDRFWRFPLSGSPATRLLTFMGVDFREPAWWTLIDHFEPMNVIERYADAEPWSTPRARERWLGYLRDRFGEERLTLPSQGLVVVCLGRRAATAVGAPEEWGVWEAVDRMQVAALPHPSGLNRVYNEPEMRALAGRVLHEAIERARHD